MGEEEGRRRGSKWDREVGSFWSELRRKMEKEERVGVVGVRGKGEAGVRETGSESKSEEEVL